MVGISGATGLRGHGGKGVATACGAFALMAPLATAAAAATFALTVALTRVVSAGSVVASVMLLDQAGGFLGSGRTPLETTRLRPGDDVGFSVELPSHKEVRRYRVTFRGVDGGLVPHADKRVR